MKLPLIVIALLLVVVVPLYLAYQFFHIPVIDQYEAVVNGYETNAKIMEENSFKASGEIAKLNGVIEGLSLQKDELQQNLDSLDNDYQELSRQLESLSNEMTAAETELRTKERDYARLEADNARLKEQIDSLDSDISSLNQKINQIKTSNFTVDNSTPSYSVVGIPTSLINRSLPSDFQYLTIGIFTCTGSMRPTLECNRHIAVSTTSLGSINIGDIITYSPNEYEPSFSFYDDPYACNFDRPSLDTVEYIAHRVIKKRVTNGVTEYLTKGDNNPGDDGCWITKSDIHSKVVMIIDLKGF